MKMKFGSVRIIAGLWKGRKISVLNMPGLRPTRDQIRETLFNWLQPIIQGAVCLDMFAGSGALGFEALSRGAKSVVMIDHSKEIVANLRLQATKLQTMNAQIYCAVAPTEIKKPVAPFDLVFIDPPFAEKNALACALFLERNNFLGPITYIYIESAESLHAEELPLNWELLKIKKTGHVSYHLIKRCECLT